MSAAESGNRQKKVICTPKVGQKPTKGVHDYDEVTNTYWIASGTKGLIGIRRKNANSFETIVSGLNIEGPKRNYNDLMFIKKGKLLIAGGTYTPTARGYRAGTLMSYENRKWTNFDEGAAATL